LGFTALRVIENGIYGKIIGWFPWVCNQS